jgi:hypothetical protein
MTIEQETGELLLSRYGNTFALGFKGDAGFRERCYNFVYNFCAINNGSLIQLTENMSYVLTSPVKIMSALKLYYYNQVIRNKEVAFSFDEEGQIHIDEEAAEKISMQKAEAFFNEKIRKENFMFNQYLDKRVELSCESAPEMESFASDAK